MAARDTRFSTIRTEGGLLPPDLLARITVGGGLDGLDAESYGLARGERLAEAISRAWESARSHWASWQATRGGRHGAGVTELREQWLIPLFRELDYDRLTFRQAAEEIEGRRYVISHRAGNEPDAPPVHTLAPDGGLDHAARADGAGPKRSPHGLLQEYLNASPHLWGILTDGLTLRLLGDNASLSRAAYIEADLAAMFDEGNYADFVLLYLLLHRSRLPQPGQPVEEAWLERWRREGEAAGARARENLRQGVETAITAFGQGLLDHPQNDALRERLRSETLKVEDYYRQLLRLVYRLIFLLAAEERDLLFAGDADGRKKRVYGEYYAIDGLRDLARRRSSDRHDDLWRRVQTVFRALREEESAAMLGLAPLGGLFDPAQMPDIDGRGANPAALLSNGRLLEGLRGLGWTAADKTLRRVNYRDMDVEELGSVYEGLLEQQPRIERDGERVTFRLSTSGERKTTGSYYTNPGLVRELIRSALEPAIAGALERGATREEKRRNLLDLKVCDPACGSGHFLLAAARRIGRALAELEAGEDEPSPARERAAIRAAIGHCIHGVDLNALAVDLCRVALWLEGQHAGKPLQFLDHHIRHGNALIGATAAAMAAGVPDAAFDPVTGDSKTYATTIKRRNREERKGQRTLDDEGWQVVDVSDEDARRRYFATLDASDDTMGGVQAKAREFYLHQRDAGYLQRKLIADLWTAAFFWPLEVGEANPPTEAVWRRLRGDEHLTDYLDRRNEARLGGHADFRTARTAYRLAREHHFFHWELEFEDVFSRPDPGFDVILGNPPWERIKLQEQEFFAQRDPAVSKAINADARKKSIAALAEMNPSLFAEFEQAKRGSEAESKFLRSSGRFPLTGRGDINTYSVFTESAIALIGSAGLAGLVIPDGIAFNATNSTFFETVNGAGRIKSIYGFKNERFLFRGVEHTVTFALFTAGGSERSFEETEYCWLAWTLEEMQDPSRRLMLTQEDIHLLNPNTRTAPVFRTRRDTQITKRLYDAAPVLVREGAAESNPWGVTFQRAFDMNKVETLNICSRQFDHTANTVMYEAKLFHQFDHRWATYESNLLRDMSSKEKSDAGCSVHGRYFLPREEVLIRHPDYWKASWLIGYRDIARNTDERTVISAILPLSGTDMTVRLLFPRQPVRAAACLHANLNTVTFDYAFRQKLGGTHLSDYLTKQLPVLPPETYTPALLDLIAARVLELTFTAWDLAPFARDLGYAGDPFPWDEERRAILRAELDGIYAHLYGLDRDDFDYILGTFRIVNEKDERRFGEERTRRLCLEAYDYYAPEAQQRLWNAVREIEKQMGALVVKRLRNDLTAVPEHIQAQQEPERLKEGKPPRAASLADFLEAGYLTLIGKVIRANREPFADLFASNGQVEAHLSPVVGLRNALAHTKEAQLPHKLRRSGEAEIGWFAETLHLPFDLVPPPALVGGIAVDDVGDTKR